MSVCLCGWIGSFLQLKTPVAGMREVEGRNHCSKHWTRSTVKPWGGLEKPSVSDQRKPWIKEERGWCVRRTDPTLVSRVLTRLGILGFESDFHCGETWVGRRAP